MGPSLKILFKNKNYIIIFLTYGLFCGNFLSIGVTMAFIFKPYGFGPEVNSFAGIGLVISGVVGSGIGGRMFKSNPRFKIYIVIGIIGKTFFLQRYNKTYLFNY